MYSYIVRRLAFGAVTVLGVSIVVFFVLRVLPGDPLVAIFGTEGFTKLTAARARQLYGTAWPERSAGRAVSALDAAISLSGSLGHSFFRSESVARHDRAPRTADRGDRHHLGRAVVARRASPSRSSARCKPNSFGDNVSRFLSILFLAVPGLLAGDADRPGAAVRASATARRWPASSLFTDPLAQSADRRRARRSVLGLGQAAYIARMARSSLLEVIREDYVRTARAKGLNRPPGDRRHALPNALLPVITLSGILLGFVLAGSIPVERAFGTPGLGYAMFTAVNERDIFVMQNLVFLYSDRVRAAEHPRRSDDRLARPEDPLPMSATQPDASPSAAAIAAWRRADHGCGDAGACCASSRGARRCRHSGAASPPRSSSWPSPRRCWRRTTRSNRDFRAMAKPPIERCIISAPTRSAATR